MTEKTAQKEPGKKPVPSKKPKPQQEVVVQIPLSELHPFPDHPFQVREDASMQETAESVKEYGVLVPALARPREDGGYELIAGHRRKHACELAGLATMPVIVRDIDRDAATIIMVDSNLQRENILPSERAKAYKMKMEAIKRQGVRTDLTSPKISAKFRSDDEVGQDAGVSGDTIRNYIALTQLVPELQQMVDEKKIALSPAYQIAALTPKEQGLLLETIDSEQATPSLSQAQRMKKLSQSGELNEDTMLSINFSPENKCWFYLITYYLNTLGYEIKEFPRILARPPAEPADFTYGEIRNRIIALGGDDNGTVRYATRRAFVAELTFMQKSCNIEVSDSINQKFIEISTRQASFNCMHTDEKIAEIANLIENMLKQDGKFITPEYEKVCCGFIDDTIVKNYRKQMQCFRHCTDEAIAERKTYSEEQKTFLVDYGLTIVKAIHELIK